MSESWHTKPKSTARLFCDAFEVRDGADQLVARVFLTDDGTNGAWKRASLIATAPALLAALLSAREQLEEYERERTGETYNNLQINAAIAKATGVSP